MKVLMINGSPNERGCTYTALSEISKVLNAHGIETDILYLGKQSVPGCIACSKCRETGKCCFDDSVNETIDRLKDADGLIVGSPVYYGAASGQITSFLNRLFFSGARYLKGKPGAAIVSCRRAGSTAALEQLNKYFTISSMPLVSSQYWNMVHGSRPEEVLEDVEGLQTMRVLGENMAWLLKCIEAGRAAGVPAPEYENRVYTNFIRQQK